MRRQSQALNLQKMMQRQHTRVLAITGGKGGVGKTNIAANVAVALGKSRRSVLLLDADLGLANIDVLLGLTPQFNLSHVVSGEVDLARILVDGPHNVSVIPAASGNKCMTELPQAGRAAIIKAFSDLTNPPDYLVIDTAAGISENVARFVQAAQQAIVVVCDEPASLTDAYALIKVLSKDYGIYRFEIVCNQTRDRLDGRRLYEKIRKVTDQYLDVVLRHLGNIPLDMWLRRAVQEQRPVVDAYPRSPSAVAFGKIAADIDSASATGHVAGCMQFFFENLLDNSRLPMGSNQ